MPSQPPTSNFGEELGGALPSAAPAPEASASQEAAGHAKCFHVHLLLLRPGGSPAEAQQKKRFILLSMTNH